jgi:DNA-binding MarR family transcriptional regulator
LTINDALTDSPTNPTPDPTPEELAGEILRTLSAARAAATSEEFRALADRSVSVSHLHLLVALRAHEPMRMGVLAHRLGISVANATGIVSRMEERGLVERSRDPRDQRAVNVQLAPGGRQVLETMDQRTRQFFADVLGELSLDELTQLRNAVRAVFRAAAKVRSTAKEGHDR